MMASDYGVVDVYNIIGSNIRIWILMVELDHLDGICEGIQWKLNSFGDGNKLVGLVFDGVGRECGDWFDEFRELSVGFNVVRLYTSDLHVEHMTSVEQGLLLFPL